MNRLRLLLPLLLVSSALMAQSYQLMSIRGTGSQLFSSDEIAAACGLNVGQMVTFTDLQTGANTLANTGVFSSVNFKYGPEGSGYEVEYQVEDAKEFLPVIYENFVWASDADLNKYVAANFPLFHGKVAETGEMMQRITEVLTRWLGENHLQGTVGWQLQGEGMGGPIDGVSFFVKGVKMPVTSVSLLDTPNLSSDERHQVEKEMTSGDYEASVVRDAVQSRLMPFYERKGYLRANVVSTQVKPTVVGPGTTNVALVFTINEGRQYKFGSLTWSGNSVFSSADLDKQVKFHPGKVADGELLQQDIASARKLYTDRGFLQARFTPVPSFNDATSEVSYQINVAEGPLFLMGRVEIVGLDPGSSNRLLKAWKLKMGEPFTQDYVGTFLKENMGIIHGRPARVKQTAGPDHVVNITLQF